MKVGSTTNSRLSSLKDGAQPTQQGDAAPVSSGASGAPAQSSGGPASDASVNLSGLSSSLRSLAVTGSADIDVAQVESIKAAIKDGTLTIDTSKIADGVLETARNLLQNPSNGG